MAKRRREVDTWKLKKPYRVVAPKSFEEKELGITFADDPKKLINRVVEVAASELAGDFSLAPYILRFKIVDVTDDTARTELIGHYVDRAYMKRFVRRRSSKIECVFDVKTKDEKFLHAKIIVFSLHKLHRRQKTAIRKIAMQTAAEYAAISDKDLFIQLCIFGKLPAEISQRARKIAPIRRVEVEKTRLLVTKKPTLLVIPEKVPQAAEQAEAPQA